MFLKDEFAMKLWFVIIIALLCGPAWTQPLPGVDPKVGPIAGRVYVDPERWNTARSAQFENVDQLLGSLDSKTNNFPGVGFDLTSVPLSEVIQLYFSEVARAPYVICSEVLSDKRFVSLRATGKALDRAMMIALLDTNGLALNTVAGIATVCLKPPQLTEEQKAARNGKVFSYQPKYRSVADLIRVATPLVVGVFANGNTGEGNSLSMLGGRSSSATTTLPTREIDEVLVFSGNERQIARLKEIMAALDVPSSSVIVRAVLYEVSDSAMEASALKVIADLVNGKVGVSIGGAGLSGNSLSISSTSLDFVASMISEDSRFKILTRPFLRVQNGKSARFQVGQDVPVVGEILFNPNGQSAQSFKYVSSGVIFEVAAHIRENAISLDIVQTVSNFVKTTVGNSENPTANKREISTSLTLGDGEIVILGGLSDEQRERSAQGLFGWNFAKSEGTRNSQLVLVLQAQRV